MKEIILLIIMFITHCLHAQGNRGVVPTAIDTTLIFPNLIIELNSIQAQDFDEYYLPNQLIDSLSRDYGNFYNKSLSVEKFLMKRFGSRVMRNGQDLSVKLDNDEWMLLENNSDFDESGHTFEYYFEQFGLYSIRVQWGEGNAYKLVRAKTGDITNIIGRPYFSPEGTKIMALGNDIEAGYSANGFQLLKNENGEIKEIGSFYPSDWGCKSARWLSNNELILKNETFEFDDPEMDYFDFYTELKIR
jgi:hypothetical protein